MKYTLSYLYDFLLYQIRGHPLCRFDDLVGFRGSNAILYYFHSFYHTWIPLSLHRSSERYYKIIDYLDDKVTVCRSANDVYLHLIKKYFR